MKLAPDQALVVFLRDSTGGERRVGRLAWRERRAWFEYDPAFVASGPSISPVRLPLRPGLHEAPLSPFDGLFGVMADSLPDGWGRLLQDRLATSRGLSPAKLTPLDRLAWVGRHGIGALRYEPEIEMHGSSWENLDGLAEASARVLAGAADDVLPRMVRLGGSPQGARPKVLVWLRPGGGWEAFGGEVAPGDGYIPVLVKFRAKEDTADAGALEYAYHQLARAVGIDVPEAWLVPSPSGRGWFAVRRFDHTAAGRVHTHTLAGLLHADHRLPSLDYVGGIVAGHRLTRDVRVVEEMFRRMVFNVVMHNRDDHTKQTSFLLGHDGVWRLAPAYDLTFSEGPGGEHSQSVAGVGEPDLQAVLSVAEQVGLGRGRGAELTRQISGGLRQRARAAIGQPAWRRIGKRLRWLD